VSSPDPSHIAALSKSSKRPKSQSLDCSQWLEDLWCCLMLHKISKETCLTMCHQWHGLQAEGRCRFFKWQDELGNGPTAPQQQSGPAAQQPAVPSPQGMNAHGNRMSNKAQGVPAAAAGGSGVFADEGELMLDIEAQVWQQHEKPRGIHVNGFKHPGAHARCLGLPLSMPQPVQGAAAGSCSTTTQALV